MNLENKISDFPTSPGVYLMKGEGGKIIYVGKAKNLRSRIRCYFNREADSRYQIEFLMKRVQDIDTLMTGTEKEALLLENSLIKKHKPKYNIFLKDDKTYVSIKLNINHPYPKITVTRYIKKEGALYFGPYASSDACRETVDFIQHEFKLRTCTDMEIINRVRPCIEYQIKRCTAPCVNYVTKEQYLDQVAPVRLFLEGRNKELTDEIERRMNEDATNEKFEEAAHWRDLLANLSTTLEKQRVVKHGGTHQDVIYLYKEEERGIVAVLNVRNGSLVDSRYYPIMGIEDPSTVMEQFLNQYYLSAPFIPDEILISTPIENPEVLLEYLSEKKGKKVELRIPQKGEKHKLLELAEKNAVSQFTRIVKKEYEARETLAALQKSIGLKPFPHRIECYDISNISGKKATGSRVVFIDGRADKKHYRHYKIRMKEEPNDYAMMREILERRFRRGGPPWPPTIQQDPIPDLLIVDGGKGQLNTALKVLQELEINNLCVIGVAKGSGAIAKEEIFLPNRKNPLILRRGSPELMLLQRIRDEAHRFAITYHRKLRDEMGSRRNIRR